VTDAMPVVGTDIERFSFFDREIIRHGDKLNATTGELAGSALDMASAVKNTVEHLKQPLNIALNMASLYPAQHMGLADKRGHFLRGAIADIVALDDDLNILNTWHSGVKQVK
ncbi:MAG: N-acetylglucosamine-6-phosphate deacetylase, partial [Psychrobium sp.]|nr:N-acetylglucosamine-6-phosphate deacetylase [Psychrobium sp.]